MDRKQVARGDHTDPHRDERRGRPGWVRSVPRLRAGQQHPSAALASTDPGNDSHPFLESPPELRQVIHTTTSIESLNYRLRKIIKNRGHFPNDAAVRKLLWLTIRDIEDKRASQQLQERGIKQSLGHSRWPTQNTSNPTQTDEQKRKDEAGVAFLRNYIDKLPAESAQLALAAA